MSTAPTICIVDYGVGNLYSVVKAFKQFSSHVIVTEEAADIRSSDALILPGVGAFEAGMQGLKVRGLEGAVKDFSQSGKPVLGICLGAQIMLNKGYEFGEFNGLGLVAGDVVGFSPLVPGTKVPHIGWNEIMEQESDQWKGTILKGIRSTIDSVYFVHSFIFKLERPQTVFATTTYGGQDFCSVFRKENIYGCQFHPEKSGQVGLTIIKNFVELI